MQIAESSSSPAPAPKVKVRLRKSDIERIRTGQPVSLPGDFYPTISQYVSERISEAKRQQMSSFTKLVIADFGEGKSTLCQGLAWRWHDAGFAVSHIYIRSEYRFNNLHVNLLKEMRYREHDFFGLLLLVAQRLGNTTSSYLLNWVADNSERLARAKDDPEFRSTFWEWFAENRIRSFNHALDAIEVPRVVAKMDQLEARNFLSLFCELLTQLDMQPLLIIDELESIAGFTRNGTSQTIITRLRELIDNAHDCYSLVLASTDAFFMELAHDYRALYDRLYNAPTLSASASSWHLKFMRHPQSVRDFFLLLKNSDECWSLIPDADVSKVLEVILGDDSIKISDLRPLLRQYVQMLDEAIEGGSYKGLLGGMRDYTSADAQTVDAPIDGADGPISKAPTELPGTSMQSDETELNWLEQAKHLTSLAQAIRSNASGSPFPLGSFTAVKRLAEAESIYKALAGRKTPLSLSVAAKIIASARAKSGLRVITEATVQTLTANDPTFTMVQPKVFVQTTMQATSFHVALYSSANTGVALVLYGRPASLRCYSMWYDQKHPELLEDGPAALREHYYLRMFMDRSVVDDLVMDALITSIYESSGFGLSEARSGCLFWRETTSVANGSSIRQPRYVVTSTPTEQEAVEADDTRDGQELADEYDDLPF